MTMKESLPTPIDLSENPQLAVLRILKTNLEVAKRAILAAYPNLSSREPHSECCQRVAEEAYAEAILYQSDALAVMVERYESSVGRRGTLTDHLARGLESANDIPF